MGKYRFLFLVTALCILASCAKEERFSSDGFGPPDLNKGFGHGYNGKVFMVPLPDGTNDTENILNTIELAQSQGSGSVVQFQKGTYLISFMEIYGFNGIIKGAGKGKTIIKPINKLPCEAVYEETFSLISFNGGDIKLSDLSFKIDDGMICETDYGMYGGDLYSLIKFTNYLPGYNYCKSDVENVDFEGGRDNSGSNESFNTIVAIWDGFDFGAASSGNERANSDLKTTRCTFKYFSTAVDIAGVGGGNKVVKENNFIYCDVPVLIYDIINTSCLLTNNKFAFNNWFDVLIDDTDYSIYGYYTYHPPEKATSFKISCNEFKTSKLQEGDFFGFPKGVSMYLMDQRRAMHPEENLAMKFIVENNRFDLGKDVTGIVGHNNKGAMIIANKFTGAGVKGITLNGDIEIYSIGNKIFGNNFLMADYTEADIHLGPGTRNCLITGSPKAVIVNEGERNHITGNR